MDAVATHLRIQHKSAHISAPLNRLMVASLSCHLVLGAARWILRRAAIFLEAKSQRTHERHRGQ